MNKKLLGHDSLKRQLKTWPNTTLVNIYKAHKKVVITKEANQRESAIRKMIRAINKCLLMNIYQFHPTDATLEKSIGVRNASRYLSVWVLA